MKALRVLSKQLGQVRQSMGRAHHPNEHSPAKKAKPTPAAKPPRSDVNATIYGQVHKWGETILGDPICAMIARELPLPL